MATAAAPAAGGGAGGGGGDSHILREYLVALGFRIDEQRNRRMSNTLSGLDKLATGLGGSIIGIGVAAVAMAYAFAKSMERVYYNARYIGTTVGQLQAMEFAGKQIGLAGGEMTAGLKTFAGALRSNPGFTGMLERLGVPVKGRDVGMVMWDFVKATKSMSPYVAQQYAAMFGIGPEMLFNLQEGEEKARAAEERRKQMVRDMGADPDVLARDMTEYMNQWGELIEHAKVFGQVVMQLAKGPINEMIKVSHQVLDDWNIIARDISKYGSGQFWERLREGLGLQKPGGGVQLSADARARTGVGPVDAQGTPVDAETQELATNPLKGGGLALARKLWQRWRENRDRKRKGLPLLPGPGGPSGGGRPRDPTLEGAGDTSPGGVDQTKEDENSGGVTTHRFDPQEYLRALEKRYGLPAGILDRYWKQESGRGENMLSEAGAEGHFQFMPDTQKEFGLKDPYDFKQSADAAARKLSGLQKEFKGNQTLMAAGWNWGQGNLRKYGLGNAPAETRGFIEGTREPGSAGVNVNTEIHMHGVSDPQRAGEVAAQKQGEVASNVIRNMSPKVR